MKRLLIIGARGWGRETYFTFLNSQEFESGGYMVKGFLDDKKDALDGLKGDWPPIICSVEDYEVQPDDVFFCAMGDPHWRKHYVDIIKQKGGSFINIIDKKAWISPSASLGEGIYGGGFAIVSANVNVGDHVVIQAFCNIGHDAVLMDCSTLESYVFMGGYSTV